MKKAGIYAGCICLLAAVLASCGNGQVGEYKIKELKANRIAHLVESDSTSPSCRLSLNVSFLESNLLKNSVADNINAEIIETAFNYKNLEPQTAMDSFVNHYVNSYRHDVLSFYLEDRKKHDISAWFEYYYDLNSKHETVNDTILNYALELEQFEGGAHGNHYITWMNFNLNTGHRIMLSDLFVPEYKDSLTAILLKALMAQQNAKSEEELRSKDFLIFGSPMYPSENFLIHADNVEFIYNPYEIAPYAVGATTLKIPNSDLKQLLKTN